VTIDERLKALAHMVEVLATSQATAEKRMIAAFAQTQRDLEAELASIKLLEARVRARPR
jgi:hypothetical protein